MPELRNYNVLNNILIEYWLAVIKPYICQGITVLNQTFFTNWFLGFRNHVRNGRWYSDDVSGWQ